MKYRVTLAGKKFSDMDRNVKIIAVSAKNAKAIAKMRYKLEPFQAVRLGSEPSTVQTMNELKADFIQALDAGNKELAQRHEKTFYSIMVHLKSEMDVVAYNMAIKELPTLPPLGN